uniref:Uncharacterized protein n=1 Tax=Setaria digitata TaxID=48799 RepID=A0A915Q1Z8_9BILA
MVIKGSKREDGNESFEFVEMLKASDDDFQQQFGAEYGCCDQVDVEVLLLTYCRNHQGCCWAVLGSDKALTLSCNQLRQSNMQMATMVRAIAPEAVLLRSSRVSSASESYRS